MGIFYNPPPPPTGSNAATPPEPHVPIAPQGNQPPRYSTALMLVAVLASWPSDLEPRLTRPNDQQQKIAPLTLVYGQQPSSVGTSRSTFYATVASWPLDLEPRLGPPNNLRATIAPLTLTFGDSPPVVGTSAIGEATSIASWPVDLEPRLAAPNNARVSIAPLTLAYGSIPTPTPALNVAEAQAIAAWPQPTWPAQSGPKSTAWYVPPIVSSIPSVPYPYGLILSNWPADLEPRLSAPNNRQQSIATLTLPTGQQPSPQPPLSVLELTQIASTWVQTWDAQTAPKSAAWNVPPILTTLPYRPLARQIVTAWEPPWVSPPAPVTIAPLTLATGQSIPHAPLSSIELAHIVASWPIDVGPSLPWQRPPSVVVTFQTVAQPPVQACLSIPDLTAIVASWAESWGPQTGPKSAAWNVPQASVPYVPLPRLLWSAWERTWIQPPTLKQTAWNSLAASVPFSTLPLAIRGAWEDLFRLPPRLTAIAPAALVYGQPPPIQPALARVLGLIIRWTWPADLEPRLSGSNATRVSIASLLRQFLSSPHVIALPATSGAVIAMEASSLAVIVLPAQSGAVLPFDASL